MKKQLLNFLFLLLPFFLSAQETNIRGRIIIDVKDESAQGIFVTNKRTNLSHVTDLTGSFSVRVIPGDELHIDSDLYETRHFKVTEKMIESGLLTIHLNLQPIVLKEAVIMAPLTGYLDKDAIYDRKLDVVARLYKDLGVNPDASKLRDTTNFQMGKDFSFFHFNVDRMFDAVSGDLRRRQNLYAFEGREAKLTAIRNYFGDSYFTEDLKIPKEKVREFISFAYGTTMIPVHFSNGNYLGIMIEFSKSNSEYLNRLKGWQPPEN